MITDIVAKNICILRKQKGLTQIELSRYIHYSDKVISKWERGESIPDIEALSVLAEFYQIDLDSFIKEDLISTVPSSTIQHKQEFEERPTWQKASKIRHKKLVSRGARISSLVLLPLLIALIYLIHYQFFVIKPWHGRFYFLAVVPAILCANFVISLITRKTFDNTEVIFLFFASIWTFGMIVIYALWDAENISADTQMMRIWFILLFYNIITALCIILTGMAIKKITKGKKR